MDFTKGAANTISRLVKGNKGRHRSPTLIKPISKEATRGEVKADSDVNESASDSADKMSVGDEIYTPKDVQPKP